MWLARFLEALPRVLQQYPTSRFVFLTLTRKNVPVGDVRETLRSMNQAWERFRKRKEFSVVQGWIRTTEITRGEDGSAHPHFHVLLMVPANYFGKNYVTHPQWTAAWRSAMRCDYDPIVDVRAVKGDIVPAARETLKYSVKPSDMRSDPDWLLELTRQLRKLRFIASGGALKHVLKEDDESNDDLLLLGDGEAESPSVFFGWRKPEKRYKRA